MRRNKPTVNIHPTSPSSILNPRITLNMPLTVRNANLGNTGNQISFEKFFISPRMLKNSSESALRRSKRRPSNKQPVIAKSGTTKQLTERIFDKSASQRQFPI